MSAYDCWSRTLARRLLLAGALLGCDGSGLAPQDPIEDPIELQVASESGLKAWPGVLVWSSPTVKVLRNGIPEAGVTVRFSVVSGGGSLSHATVTTNASGLASTDWTVGPQLGQQVARATAYGETVQFMVHAITVPDVTPTSPMHTQAWFGRAVVTAPTIRLTTPGGGIDGIPVEFRILSGGGVIATSHTITANKGYATAGAWTLGPGETQQSVGAFVADTLRVVFNSTAAPFPTPPAMLLAIGLDRWHGTGRGLVVVDGDGREDVLTCCQFDHAPSAAPTGDRIAFLRDARLHVMNNDGSGVRPVDGLQALVWDRDEGFIEMSRVRQGKVTWSADGEWVAFADLVTRGISMVHADDGIVRPVTTPADLLEDLDPSWSPDGTRIAFSRGLVAEQFDIPEVRVTTTDGTNVSIGHGHTPIWSPDGHIAFLALDGVKMTRAEGSSTTTIPIAGALDRMILWDWSPDGQWISYTERADVTRAFVHRLGTGSSRVTSHVEATDMPVFVRTTAPQANRAPGPPQR